VKEELRKEVECLRTELKQVRDDRDSSITQLSSLRIELTEYKEQAGKSSKDCENLRVQLSALKVCSVRCPILVSITIMFMFLTLCFQETCNMLQDQNLNFQKQIAVANEKLKVRSISVLVYNIGLIYASY
jgi:kinesin family member C1